LKKKSDFDEKEDVSFLLLIEGRRPVSLVFAG